MVGSNCPQKVDNSILEYAKEIGTVADLLQARVDASGVSVPAYVKPRGTGAWREYYSASTIVISEVVRSNIRVLDLCWHPGTRTVKTIGSLLIVARAIEHYNRFGERIALLTASSGNKATALRDAVARAYALGLAEPITLRLVTVVPTSSSYKVRTGIYPESVHLGPVLVRDCRPAVRVREEVDHVVRTLGAGPTGGWRLWNTSSVDSYAHGDCVRAFVENDFLPSVVPRWHVHAVSSGYGLLGYAHGRKALTEATSPHGKFLLVQHLAAPALVLSSADNGLGMDAPEYDRAAAGYAQWASRRFPAIADDPAEEIDPTLYAREPATIGEMRAVIRAHGGDGIVVSRHECLARYAEISEILAAVGHALPANPSDLVEWATVIGLTGLLQARERGLVPADAEAIVHATGSYTDSDIAPAGPSDLAHIRTVNELTATVQQFLLA